jgi:hypothetical protein
MIKECGVFGGRNQSNCIKPVPLPQRHHDLESKLGWWSVKLVNKYPNYGTGLQ